MNALTETISERKLAANKANARNSTGPRTISGKQVSRLNVRKHGLTSGRGARLDLNELATAIAKELPNHASCLAPTIANCLESLNNIDRVRSNYIRQTDLENASIDELRDLTARISRLARYEKSAHSRLSRAIVDLLLSRA